jgi:ADP-glucose pyrophosphorylase
MTQEDIDKMHAENKGKYEKELQKSIADLTIYWKTVDKNDTSANNTISQDKESTLATFVMDLRRIAKNGFDNVDTIEKFYSSIDVKNDSKQTSLAANQWQNLSNTVNLAPKEPK